MTGFWQTRGRSDVASDHRLEMEAHYVPNGSVWWGMNLLV